MTTGMTDVSAFATTRQIQSPASASKGTIYFIQDVHANAEAQTNISKTVQALVERGKIDFIALEGAFDAVRVESFRQLPDRKHVREVSDYFLKQGKLSGALHAALTANRAFPPLTGIDDETLYNANVEAYRASLPSVVALKQQAAAANEALLAKKNETFNSKLRDFDTQVASYHSGKIRLGAYLLLLAGNAPSIPAEIKSFLEAFGIESSLNFAEVEMERKRWLSAEQKSLKDFPLLEKYLRYVRLSEELSAEKLFPEMRAMEAAAYGRLIRSDAERKLVEMSRQLALEKKLLDFSLTRDEWGDCNPTPAPSPTGRGTGWGELDSFAAFYANAEARDKALASNFLKAGAKNGILVAGGFHSAGVSRRLVEAGYAVETLVPRITKVDGANGSVYLSAFAQKKAPLDSFFEGRKLFLPTPVKGPLPEIGLGSATLSVNPQKDADVIFEGQAPEFSGKSESNGEVSGKWKYRGTGKEAKVTVKQSNDVVKDVKVSGGSGVKALSVLYMYLISTQFFEDMYIRYGDAALRYLRLAGLVGAVCEALIMIMVGLDGSLEWKITTLVLFFLLNIAWFDANHNAAISLKQFWFLGLVTAAYGLAMFSSLAFPLLLVVAFLHILSDGLIINLAEPHLVAQRNAGKDGSLTIRPMRKSDIAAVEELEPSRKLGNHIHWNKKQIARALRDGDDESFVVIKDNQIIGYAFYNFENFAYSKKILTVENLAVHQGHRGEGGGRVLMEHIKARALSRNAQAIVMYLDKHYTEPLPILKSFGFEEGPDYLDGMITSRIKFLELDYKEELLSNLEHRNKGRAEFFSMLELLNSRWWMREERVVNRNGKELIEDRGYSDKSRLEFYTHHPNPVAVLSWSNNILANSVNPHVKKIILRGFNEKLNGVPKFADLEPAQQERLAQLSKRFYHGIFPGTVDDDPATNTGHIRDMLAKSRKIAGIWSRLVIFDWRYRLAKLLMLQLRHTNKRLVFFREFLMRLIVALSVNGILSGRASWDIAHHYRPGYMMVGADEGMARDNKEEAIKREREHLLRNVPNQADLERGERLLVLLQQNRHANEMTLPQFEGVAHRLVKMVLGENRNTDHNKKDKLDRILRTALTAEKARNNVFLTDNLHNQIRTALSYATTADLRILSGIPVNEQDAFIDEIISQPDSEIIYFLNGPDEFLFDILVAEVLLNAGHAVTMIAREEPVLDGVTVREATAVLEGKESSHELFQKMGRRFEKEVSSGRFRVETDGGYLRGADLTRAAHQAEFPARWKNSVAFIAKGAGNWSTLFGQKLSRPGLFVRKMDGAADAYKQLELQRSIAIKERTPQDAIFVYQPSFVQSKSDPEMHLSKESESDVNNNGILREERPVPRQPNSSERSKLKTYFLGAIISLSIIFCLALIILLVNLLRSSIGSAFPVTFYPGTIFFVVVIFLLGSSMRLTESGTFTAAPARFSNPDAVVIQMESLPLVPSPEDPTQLEVAPEVRHAIRLHMQEGRPVGLFSEQPLEFLRHDQKWTGIKNVFIDPFLRDLRSEKIRAGPWIENLAIFGDSGASQYQLARVNGLKNTRTPRIQIKKILANFRHFPDLPKFLRTIQGYLDGHDFKLTHKLSPKDLSIDLEFREPFAESNAIELQGILREVPGAGDVEVVRLGSHKIRLNASSYNSAFRHFGAFALKRLPDMNSLGRVLAIDKGGFLRFEGLGLVPKAGTIAIERYQPDISDQPIPLPLTNTVLRRSTIDHTGAALDIFRVINNGMKWSGWSKLDKATHLKLQDHFGEETPRVLLSDFYGVLAKRGEKISSELLLELLTYLGKKGENRKMAVFTELTCQDTQSRLWQDFLIPLQEMAARSKDLKSLENLWVYSDGGAAKLRFDAGKGKFAPRLKKPLSGNISSSKYFPSRIRNWLLREGFSEHEFKVEVSDFRIAVNIVPREDGVPRAIDYVDGLRNRLLKKSNGKGSRLRVFLAGPHTIIINVHDKNAAALDFMTDIDTTMTDTTGFDAPLVLSAFSRSIDRQIGRQVKKGLEISTREIVGREMPPLESFPNYHHVGLRSTDAAVILNRYLDKPAPYVKNGKRVKPSKNKQQRLFEKKDDTIVPNSDGSFRSQEEIRAQFENPGKVAFFMSGGGAGDIWSAYAMALLHQKLYPPDRRPRIILLDSPVKRDRENYLGYSPDISQLHYYESPDLTGTPLPLARARYKDHEFRHVFVVPENLFFEGPLSDEDGNPALPINIEYEWSSGRAVKESKANNMEHWMFDASLPPNQLAADLIRTLQMEGIAPDEITFNNVDAGGDSFQRILYFIDREFEHPEADIRSATSDDMTLAVAYTLKAKYGVSNSNHIVVGLGRDGELGWMLFHYLWELVDKGHVRGVFDVVHFLREQAKKYPETTKALQTAIRDYPILSESSRVFWHDIIAEAEKPVEPKPDDLPPLDKKAFYRGLFTPNPNVRPALLLRGGTRIGVVPEHGHVVYANPEGLFRKWGFPSDKRKGSLRKLIPNMTWLQADSLIKSYGYITETSESDRIPNAQRMTFHLLQLYFQRYLASGKESAESWQVDEKNKMRYRIKGVNGGPEENISHTSPLVRLAAIAAIGSKRWRESEAQLWEIVRASNNAYLIGLAFTVMAMVGEGLGSTQKDRLLATVRDPHFDLNWTVNPIDNGQDIAAVRNGAENAYRSLFESEILETAAGENAKEMPRSDFLSQFVERAKQLSMEYPDSVDIMEKAFEELLEPFAFNPDRAEDRDIEEERAEVIEVLSGIFGLDHKLIRGLSYPDTYVVFMDREIKRRLKQSLNVPHPDIVVVQLGKKEETGETDLRFTFLDLKTSPSAVFFDKSENTYNLKNIRIRKGAQIDPTLRRKNKGLSLEGLVQALAAHERLLPLNEHEQRALRVYSSLLFKPIREKYPHIDFETVQPSTSKGFFITMRDGPIPEGFTADEFAPMRYEPAQAMILKYAFRHPLKILAKIFGLARDKDTAAWWLSLPRNIVTTSLVTPAIWIATLAKAVSKNRTNDRDMTPVTMDTLVTYLERAAQLIENNDLKTPIISERGMPRTEQVHEVMNALKTLITPDIASMDKTQSKRNVNEILSKPVENFNIVDIDGKITTGPLPGSSHVLVLIQETSLAVMTAHIDALLKGETKPESITVLTDNSRIALGLKNRYESVVGTKLSFKNRKDLFEKPEVTLAQISNGLNVGGRKPDHRINRIIVPHTMRLVVDDSIPQNFSEDLMIIVAAMSVSVIVTPQHLRTEWERVRRVLTQA